MDDPAPVVSDLDEKNALALAIVPVTGDHFNIAWSLLISYCLDLVVPESI